MTTSDASPHRRYHALVDTIDRECRVAEWRAGDVDLWPLAKEDLFLAMFRQAGGDSAPPPPPFLVRGAAGVAAPAINLWKSRHDLGHWVARPHRADAILLGDGVSLDRVDGSWRDRYGDAIVAALERQGRTCFVMQSGNLARLPWARPTFAANRVAARAAIAAARMKGHAPDLPDHAAVMRLLDQSGADAQSLSRERLARRARVTAAQSEAFDRILRRVRPSAAFVVTYYAGLGHAFALACRRLGILCVDLQHCPHDGTHRAYRWSPSPPNGYSTLPGLFWTWTEADAADIRCWANSIDRPWHRVLCGGHTQIAALRTADGERLWQEALGFSRGVREYEREILVALQPIGGRRDTWAALADAIESGSREWRWWIRRHPASSPAQDSAYERILSLTRPNVVVGDGSQIPLPALLGHMDALVSLASGAAGEAAMFGVPAFFLDEAARDTFPGLINSGGATVVGVESLLGAIAHLSSAGSPRSVGAAPIEDTLREVDRLAQDYARLCRDGGNMSLSVPQGG